MNQEPKDENQPADVYSVLVLIWKVDDMFCETVIRLPKVEADRGALSLLLRNADPGDA